MTVPVQGRLHHLAMKARRRRNKYRIRPFFIEHFSVVGIALNADIFVQHVQYITRGVANRRKRNIRVRINDGVVGKSHFAKSN